MADQKGIELLGQLLQGLSGGVRKNEDGSKTFALAPMVAGAAQGYTNTQDAKLQREMNQFNLDEAKRESARKQELYDFQKQEMITARQQAQTERDNQLKERSINQRDQQLGIKKAALKEEAVTGKIQYKPNVSAPRFEQRQVMNDKTGQMETQQFLTGPEAEAQQSFIDAEAGKAAATGELKFDLPKDPTLGQKAMMTVGNLASAVGLDAIPASKEFFVKLRNEATKSEKKWTFVKNPDGSVNYDSLSADALSDMAASALDPASPFHGEQNKLARMATKVRSEEVKTATEQVQIIREGEAQGLYDAKTAQAMVDAQTRLVSEAGPQVKFGDLYQKNKASFATIPGFSNLPAQATASIVATATKSMMEQLLAQLNDPKVNRKAQYSSPATSYQVQQTQLIESKKSVKPKKK